MTDTSNYYPQPGMDLQHVNDVMNQYIQSKQQQQNGGLLQQILSNRMQPQDQDIMTAGLREAQSYATPGGFKAYSPEGQMADRISNQLSPYSDALKAANEGAVLSGRTMDNEITAQTGLPAAMAALQSQQQHNDVYGKTGLPQALATLQEAQTKAQYADPMAQADLSLKQAHAKYFNAGGGSNGAGGGATGALVSRLMAEDPSLSFEQALYAVQTGFRQGTAIQSNGQLGVMQGAPEARGAIKQGEQTGTEQARLNFTAPIAAAHQEGEATGKAQGAIDTRAIKAPQIEMLLQQAERMLPQATSGGIQTARRDAMGYFGSATAGSEIDSQLNVIGAALTSNVPRMEGPQSDYDVALYAKAAGDLANSKIPVETRLAAIKTIRNLNSKYAAQGQKGSVPTISSPNDPAFQQLPPGAQFMTPDGQTLVKH